MRFAVGMFHQACFLGLFTSLPLLAQIHPPFSHPSQPPPQPQGILVKFKAQPERCHPTAIPSPDLERFMARHELKACDALVQPELLKRVNTRLTNSQETASPSRSSALSRIFVVQPTGPFKESLQRLKADPLLEYAEADGIVRKYQAPNPPNDPYLNSRGAWGQAHPDLWGHHWIGAPAAWNLSTGKNITVAVVDTGLDLEHPDLKGNLWVNAKEIPGNNLDDDGNGWVDDIHGYDFIGPNQAKRLPGPLKNDMDGHGTHVAGTIAATGNNGLGLLGVAYDAQLMGIKVLDDSGYGSISACVQGLLYAAAQGAQVVNCSWGSEEYSQALHESIQELYAKGVVVVAAAGNEASDVMDFGPAHFPQVITVAALTDQMNFNVPETQGFSSYSNMGARVDIAAPGDNILSLHADRANTNALVAENYALLSGTSMATPHVSGVVALILSQKPQTPVEQIRQILKSSARTVSTNQLGATLGIGCVDAAAALSVKGVLEAHIQSPDTHSTLNMNQVLNILGTAQGENFALYELQWGLGRNPESWQSIQQSTQAVLNGTLGSLDLKTLPQAVLTLRLSVQDQEGRVFRDHTILEPQFLTFTHPQPPRYTYLTRQFKPGQPIFLEGTVTLSTYELEWAPGIYPETGWTALSKGSGPLTGRLGQWPTQGLKSGYYTLRLKSLDHGLSRCTHTLIHLETDLLGPLWPQPMNAPAEGSGWVRRLDAQGNPELNLVTTNTFKNAAASRYLRLKPNGRLISQTPLSNGSMRNPACGPWGETGGQGVIFTRTLKMLSVFNAEQETQTFDLKDYRSISAPILTHIGGSPALVTLGRPDTPGRSAIFAFRPDGQPLNPSFPIVCEDHSVDYWNHLLLVGDLNATGETDFLIQYHPSPETYTLKRYSSHGQEIPFAMQSFDSSLRCGTLADLDANGTLEILLIDNQSKLHVLKSDGTPYPGWENSFKTKGSLLEVAVADLDANGEEEIVLLAYQNIFIFKINGTPWTTPGMGTWTGPWPFQPQEQTTSDRCYFSPMLRIADLDGDGKQEILVANNHMLFNLPDLWKGPDFCKAQAKSVELLAVNIKGETIKSWPLMGMDGEYVSGNLVITLDDFNADGKLDIAVFYSTVHDFWITRGAATLLETQAPWRAGLHDKACIHGDPMNQNTLSRGFSLSAPHEITLSATGTASAELLITPHYGFDGPVQWSCTGLPEGVGAEFTPQKQDAAGRFPYTLKLSQKNVPAIAQHLPLKGAPHGWALGGGLLGLGCLFPFRRKRRLYNLSILLVASLAFSLACGGKKNNLPEPAPKPAQQSYTLTLKAQRGQRMQQCQIKLKVQNP